MRTLQTTPIFSVDAAPGVVGGVSNLSFRCDGSKRRPTFRLTASKALPIPRQALTLGLRTNGQPLILRENRTRTPNLSVDAALGIAALPGVRIAPGDGQQFAPFSRKCAIGEANRAKHPQRKASITKDGPARRPGVDS